MSQQQEDLAAAAANFVDNTTYFAVTIHDNTSSVIPESKKEDEKNVCLKEANIASGGAGNISGSGFSTPSLVDSTIEEDDESKSSCSSGKDSGVGKSTDEFANGRRSSDSFSTSYRGRENTGVLTRRRLSSSSQVDLDSSSTILWGASLLYYTGIPTPKIKEHHFTPSTITPLTSRSKSSSGSAFSLFKGSKHSRSSLSLQTSGSPEMDDGRQRRSSWRFGGSSKKCNTLPINTPSPLSMVDNSRGVSPGNGGENSGSEGGSSPSRRRHANCLTPSPEISRAQSSFGIFGRFRNNSNSLRVVKSGSSTSGFSSFLEKSSSLPRSPRKNKIFEEVTIPEQYQLNKSNDEDSTTTHTSTQTTTSSGGFKSAKKAIRNSFKAAKNLLPSSSSSKIGPVSASKEGNSTSSKRGKLSLSPSAINDTDNSSTMENVSAPNTPVAVKMSKLERAKKRFSSTLSLHTTDHSSSSTGRSKSTSTLNILDVRPVSRRDTLPWDNYYQGHASDSCHTGGDTVDGEHSSISTVSGVMETSNKSGQRRESGSSLRSPFRFISRSKKGKESKTESNLHGSEIRLSQLQQNERELEKDQTSHEDCREPHQTSPSGKFALSPTVAEKPAKKRMSLVESLVGKTILRGSTSSSKKKNANKGDLKNEENHNQPSITNATTEESIILDSDTRKNKEPISNARQELTETQEIVTFDNEPRRVRSTTKLQLKSESGEEVYKSPAFNSKTNSAPVKAARSASRTKKEHKVKETSIDLSPERKNESLQQLQHPCYVIPKSGKVDSNLLASVGGPPSVLQSSFNDALPKTSPKKSISQGLISGIAALTPTTSFSSVKNMGEKTGRGNKKKTSKKPSSMTSSTTTNSQQHTFVGTAVLPAKNNTISDSTTIVETTVSKELLNGNCRVIDNNKLNGTSSLKPKEEECKDTSKTTECNGNACIDKDDAPVVLRNGNVGVLDNEENSATDAAKSNAQDDEENENDSSQTDAETACTESFRQLQPFNYDLEPVEEGKKERLYKVLVVGELGAGKTSIIKRYVHQFFSQHYRATIGVDFALKVLRWDPDTVVRLQLWDIAGQERFGSMTRVYYKEAVGAFVVFDVTRAATLEAVPKWKADLDAKVALPDGRPIPTVLLANKSDQPKEGIAANREKMNDFCQQQGFSAWFETSAKDNINIDESANFLVSKILEMDKWSHEPLAVDPDKVELTANGKHKASSSSNCAC